MQLQNGVAAAVNGRWLLLGRIGWMLTVVFTLGLFAAGIPVISAEMLSVCEGPSCYRWQPTPQLVTELTGFGLPVATYLIYKLGLEVLFVLSSCLIAAVLVWRRSDEPMAPMHALANSQLGELQKFLLYGYPPRRPPVTFERYTGQQSQADRERIKANPPDILRTNFVMLELILTRPSERAIVRSAEGLEFLVLDELHTYRSRQRADVAMLVRRIRERCGAPTLSLRWH